MISLDRRSPFALEPTVMPAIWGGNALVTRYGKPGDPHATLGESWECWDENHVPAYGDATVAALRGELGADLLGPLDPQQRFPVLTKIIDAHGALSVQVHPNDAYAQRVEHQPVGKTECWYILDAEPGAELVLGWTRDTDRAEYERRVADGTLGDILRRVPVRAGQGFYLPAGTLHAIGAGIQLFEVQQASDLTYRIFDWNRLGADGKPRPLHVAKAADVLDFRATEPGAVTQLAFDDLGASRTLIVADPRFTLERLTIGPAGAALEPGGLPLSVTAAGSPLGIACGERELHLGPWQTAIVPAAAPRVVFRLSAGSADALVARVRPDLTALRAAVAAAGVTPARSAAFFGQFPAA